MPRPWLLFLLMGTIAARADVIVGVSGPLSGASQQLGLELVGGVKAAVAALNNGGGLSGEYLQVVTADDGCDDAHASEAAQKLIAQQVNVVIGSPCSSADLGLAPVLEKAGITLIVPNATMAAVTEGGASNVVRIGPRADAQGAFAARRILAKRPGAHLAIIDDGTPQMKQLVASFTAAFGKDVALAATALPGTTDFAAMIDKAKGAGIDTVYLALQANDAGRLVAAFAAAGLTPKRYGPDSLLDDAFWHSAGAAGESTLVSFPADPQSEPAARALARAMKADGGDPAGPALAAYAAVQLFEGAGQPHGGLAVASALKSGDTFTTVLGPLRFDAKGDAQDLRFAWYSWNNGQYQTIAPEQP